MSIKRQGLIAARKATGHSQERLAQLLHVEPSTVSRWETGETEPQPPMWPRLAKALRISTDKLTELLAAGRAETVTAPTSTSAVVSLDIELTPGAALRRLREDARMSQHKLAKLVHYDVSYINKVETGAKAMTAALAARCDEALQTRGTLASLVTNRDSSRQRTDSSTSAGLAAGSDLVHVPVVIAGRTVIVPVDRRTLFAAGLGVLAGSTFGGASPQPAAGLRLTPPILDQFVRLRSALVDQDSLLGPGRILATVYEQICTIEELLGSASGQLQAESFEIASLYAEFYGWLLDDAADLHSGRYWTDRALEWAEASGNPVLSAYILMRKSQQAALAGSGALALGLGTAGERAIGIGSRQVLATCLQQQAHGYALDGDEIASLRLLDRAEAVLDALDEPPNRYGLGSYCDMAYVQAQRGLCLMALGRPNHAVEVFDAALAMWPATYHREHGLHLARKALALAAARRPDEAAGIGSEALAIVQQTGSSRAVRELVRVADELAPWQTTVSEVQDFRNELASWSAPGQGGPSS